MAICALFSFKSLFFLTLGGTGDFSAIPLFSFGIHLASVLSELKNEVSCDQQSPVMNKYVWTHKDLLRFPNLYKVFTHTMEVHSAEYRNSVLIFNFEFNKY